MAKYIEIPLTTMIEILWRKKKGVVQNERPYLTKVFLS